MLDKVVPLKPGLDISNEQFLKAIFGDSYIHAHVCSFTQDPSAIPTGESGRCWAGGAYKDTPLIPGNQFYCVSLFSPVDGRSKRRKANFSATYVIGLDDVKEKLPVEQVTKLPPPSIVIKSSLHSEQWLYLLETPETNSSRVDNLLDGLIKNGLAPDGKDPGMKSISRLLRLPGPESVNTKAKRIAENGGTPPKCKVTEWHPERRYTLEQLAAPFGVDLEAPRNDKRVDGAANVPDHPLLHTDAIHIKEMRSPGRYEITCPWVGDHTDNDDSGSAMFTNNDAEGSIGFRCHHGSCQDRTGKDLLQYIEAQSPGFNEKLKQWQTMREFTAVMPSQEATPVSFLIPLAEQQQSIPSVEPDFSSTVGMDCDVELSHSELATQLGLKYFYKNARYVNVFGRWLIWDGNRWLTDTRMHHMSLVGQFLTVKGDEIKAWANSLPESNDDEAKKKAAALTWAKREAVIVKSAPMRMNVCSFIKTDQRCSVDPDIFDSNLSLVGTPGGTVDLITGVLSKPEQLHHITKSLGVTPVDGRPELWISFLNEIMGGDQDIINFLQRLCGYALTGKTVEQKLFFLYGSGANGKSVFLDVLFHIFGEYAKRAPASLFLEQKNEQHPTALAGLQGARLAVGSELPAGQTWNETLVKDITGGDIITARLMRQDFFEYVPQFTLMIAGNHQPRLKNVDEAMSRRMVLVPFTVTIPAEQRDHKLTEKLKVEAGQILSWMIEGSVAYHRDGLDVPESVKAASKEYLDDEDVLAEFLSTCCISDAPGEILFNGLYQSFRIWSSSQGIVFPWTERALRKAIKEKGYTIERSNNKYRLKGLSLKVVF